MWTRKEPWYTVQRVSMKNGSNEWASERRRKKARERERIEKNREETKHARYWFPTGECRRKQRLNRNDALLKFLFPLRSFFFSDWGFSFVACLVWTAGWHLLIPLDLAVKSRRCLVKPDRRINITWRGKGLSYLSGTQPWGKRYVLRTFSWFLLKRIRILFEIEKVANLKQYALSKDFFYKVWKCFCR